MKRLNAVCCKEVKKWKCPTVATMTGKMLATTTSKKVDGGNHTIEGVM